MLLECRKVVEEEKKNNLMMLWEGQENERRKCGDKTRKPYVLEYERVNERDRIDGRVRPKN